jgi:cytochrome c biogenesis protein CcmG/thiol:disulfide interchange protein DsbE
MSAAARWASRIARVGRTRLAVTAAAIVAVGAALIVIGSTIGASGPGGSGGSGQSLGYARNFDLSVLGHPGKRLSLSTLSGKPVIINFFASWCDPCQRETPMIARFYRGTKGRPAIVGIDVNDSARAAEAFVRKSGVAYPVAVDPPPMKTAIGYRLPGLPATFFLDSRHRIVKRVFGAVTRAGLASGASLITGRAG